MHFDKFLLSKSNTCNFIWEYDSKNIITCIALLWELLSIFINKGLYVLVFVFVPVFFISNDTKILMILNILFFLTIAGAISNNTMFDPTKDKYYAMILMRMDARKYTLTNYLYNMFKILLGMGSSLICLRFSLIFLFIYVF